MSSAVGPAEGIERVIRGDCRDPFSILGMRQENGKLVVRALLPGADSVSVVEAPSGRVLATMSRLGDTALFVTEIRQRREPFAYRLKIDWGTHVQELEDNTVSRRCWATSTSGCLQKELITGLMKNWARTRQSWKTCLVSVLPSGHPMPAGFRWWAISTAGIRTPHRCPR